MDLGSRKFESKFTERFGFFVCCLLWPVPVYDTHRRLQEKRKPLFLEADGVIAFLLQIFVPFSAEQPLVHSTRQGVQHHESFCQ